MLNHYKSCKFCTNNKDWYIIQTGNFNFPRKKPQYIVAITFEVTQFLFTSVQNYSVKYDIKITGQVLRENFSLLWVIVLLTFVIVQDKHSLSIFLYSNLFVGQNLGD